MNFIGVIRVSSDFAQPEFLYRLARSGSTADRTDLAQAVTSLLKTSLTAAERSLAQDILLQLLSEAELDLRKKLAEQLAVEPNCPQALLDFLIYENPFVVSESVLRLSEKLSDEYLIEVAKRFENSDYWAALAKRKNIGEDLARFLIGTDDVNVFQILVENEGAKLCSSGINWLVNAAPHIPSLQAPLLARPEVTRDLAVQLYWHVSENLRNDIVGRFKIDKDVLDKAMERIVRHQPQQKKDRPKITADALLTAARLKEENKITSRQILDALKKGDIGLFICLWSSLLDIIPDKIMSQLEQDFVTSLSVLSHHARITRSDFNNMFLQWRKVNPFPEHKLEEMALTDVMGRFDKMNFEKSKKAIARWQEQGEQTLH